MARPRKSTTAMDWLPLAREAPFLNRPADKNFIKTRKTRDWLVRFAFALSDEARPVKQPQQGRMLAKVHVFLQDFIPGGLTGSFSHIHGDDVMRYLLSHSTEHTVSRHKLTKDAEIAFTQLQEWMSGCQNWQAALKRGNVGTGDTPKRRLSIKIPGHYSPAGMMAILIIANPAPKMREMIGKLQIEWMMMQDPKTLKVEGGFWHGINSQNVTNVFLREDYRESEVAFLADYTSIFGKSYTRCKRDIRPFVQPWAQHMELGGELSDSGLDDPDDDPDDSDDSLEDLDGLSLSGLDDHEGHERETGQAHRTEAVHNRPERRMAEAAKNTIEEADPMSTDWNATFLGAVEAALHVERDWEAEPYKDFQDHRRWLIGHFEGQPSNSKNILRVWCRSWADRITAADSDEDRLIVRSLFFRSLQSLRSFRESPSIAHYTDAFMILDMEDEQVESPIPNPSRLPGDLDGASVFEKLGRAVDRALDRSSATVPIEQTIRLMHTRHPIFISEVLTNPITCQYVEDVITLVDYRIKAVIKVLQAIRDVDLLPTLSFEVWKATVSRALKLTNWQLLLLIPHMWNVRAVLTDWQYYVACRKHQSDAEPTALPAAPTEPEPIRDDELVKCDEETRAVLKRLFGSLSKSPSASVADASIRETSPTVTTPEVPTLKAVPSANNPSVFSDRTSNAPRPPSGRGFTRERSNRTVSATPSGVPDEPSIFAGKRSAIKRPCSPLFGLSKRQRLDEASARSLEEMHSSLDKWKQEADEQKKMQDETIRNELFTLQEEFRSLRDQINSSKENDQRKRDEFIRREELWKEDWQRALDAIATRVQSTSTTLDQLSGQIQSSEVGAALSAITSELSSVVDKVNTVMEGLEEIKENSLSQSLAPGQDGYLAQECPSPGDEGYETDLKRAALLYISLFEFPATGVDADEEAFNKIRAQFPQLNQAHLEKALQHMHMQIYKRPLLESSLSDDEGRDSN